MTVPRTEAAIASGVAGAPLLIRSDRRGVARRPLRAACRARRIHPRSHLLPRAGGLGRLPGNQRRGAVVSPLEPPSPGGQHLRCSDVTDLRTLGAGALGAPGRAVGGPLCSARPCRALRVTDPTPRRPLPAPSPCRQRARSPWSRRRRVNLGVTLTIEHGQGGRDRRRDDDDVDHLRAQDARDRGCGHRDERPEHLSAVLTTARRRRSLATRSASRSRSRSGTSTRRVMPSTWRSRRARPTSTGSGSR